MTALIPTRPPRKHQQDALKKAYGMSSFFYQMEMGTGKSKVAIDELLQLYLDGKIQRALIVAGKGSYADWLAKHLPENVPDYISVVAHQWEGGGSVEEKKGLHRLVNGPGGLRILVMNVEAFGMKSKASVVAENFVKNAPCAVICDESTKIKNIDADRTMVMVRIGRHAVVRRAMTGSAVTKSPLDLWGQMAFLGLSSVLGSNYHTFRARYCVMKRIGFNQKVFRNGQEQTVKRNVDKVIGYRDIPRLERLVEPYRFRVLKEDCLDLPPKIYMRRLVALTDEQKSLYRQMAKFATVEFDNGGFASTSHAMTKVMRLTEIARGYITEDDGTIRHLKNNRLAAVDDIINDSSGKTAFWCARRPEVDALVWHFRENHPELKVVEYHGGTPPDERAKAVAEFEYGDADIWISTSAAAYGLTLISCNQVVYYGNSFDLEHRVQSEDRFHRMGQKRSVTYTDIIAHGTVEERILKALIAKKNVSDMVMGDGVRSWLADP